jgi:hypothetical protein
LRKAGQLSPHVSVGLFVDTIPPRDGETVYLLGERRSPIGTLYEIGSRARVLACTGSTIELEIDGDRIACPASLVARRRAPRSRARAWAPPRPAA